MKQLIIGCLLLMSWSFPALAKNVEGVELPETITVEGMGDLVLNGFAIRQRMFMKAYVGSLYVPKKNVSDKELMGQVVPMRMAMNVLFKLIPERMVVSGWSNNVPVNISKKEFKALEPRLEQFYSYFRAMSAGDAVYIDFIPGKGTQVSINDEVIGLVEGDDFFPALLKVWIGEDPVDLDFKAGLLGKA